MKTADKRVSLAKGEVSVYDFATIKLHAYKTNDVMGDEVFVLEKEGRGIIIEPPCFFENIKELETYILASNMEIEAILPSYHMAGASLLKGVPVYSTKTADEFAHNGGGKALIDNFSGAFGDAFDNSIFTVTNPIESDTITLAGITFKIVPTMDAFDIEIPEIDVVYTHMLGHDSHSIVTGNEHADVQIAQLKDFLSKGYTLILSSHYTPESLKDVETKIQYLQKLQDIAKNCANAESFKKAVHEQFPEYTGENYLDMTATFFYQA